MSERHRQLATEGEIAMYLTRCPECEVYVDVDELVIDQGEPVAVILGCGHRAEIEIVDDEENESHWPESSKER